MDGNEVERHSSMMNLSALAFKIMTDPFVGKLFAFFRVYSGTMNSGSYVY